MSDVFRVGLVNRWEGRDPRTGLNYGSFLVQWHIYEPPLRLLPGSNQVEALLLDYPLIKEPDPQGLAYSAGVRSGARFSDGTELTAEHVAASLEKTAAFKVNASASARVIVPLSPFGSKSRTSKSVSTGFTVSKK